MMGFLLLAIPLGAQITVDTFAGGVIRSGVPAQDVALSNIAGLAWDHAGNLVFCDQSANVIAASGPMESSRPSPETERPAFPPMALRR
jgi:hypothetical protein